METANRQVPALPLALAVLAGLVVADLVSGVSLAGVYGISALITSILGGVRSTVVVAVVAVASAAAIGIVDTGTGTGEAVTRTLLCAVIVALSVLSVSRRIARESQLRRVNIIAETAQRAVVRAMPDQVGPVRLASRYVSASREAHVGGDLYEVVETPHGVRLIIGDVRGKGLDAVQLAASVMGAFRQVAFGMTELDAVAQRIDEVVTSLASDEDFVTALIVQAGHDGALTLVNCGHHGPLLIADNGRHQVLESPEPDLPLGMGAAPRQCTYRWSHGDRLLLFTDGLVEARGVGGHFFPLLQQAEVLSQRPLAQVLDDLVDAVDIHTGGAFADDMALVIAEHH